MFLSVMEWSQNAPSLSQAQRLKKLSQEGKLTPDAMREIMNEVKKGDLERVTFRNETLRKYFPRNGRSENSGTRNGKGTLNAFHRLYFATYRKC